MSQIEHILKTNFKNVLLIAWTFDIQFLKLIIFYTFDF